MTNILIKLNALNCENSKLNKEHNNILITVRLSTVSQALQVFPYFHPKSQRDIF